MATINDPRPLTRSELTEFLPSQRAIRAFEKLFDLIPGDLITLLNEIDAARNEATGAQSYTARNLSLISGLDLSKRGLVFVSRYSDLPKPNGGAITLLDNYTYFFVAAIDLAGDRIVCGSNTAIIGSSKINSQVSSTGLTGYLLTAQSSLELRNISLSSSNVLEVPAASSLSLTALGCSFNATSVGLNVSGLATIASQKYILNRCDFSGGGTYISGIQHDDARARFEGNSGISNSRAVTGYYMVGNSTATTIVTTGVAVKVAGATTEAAVSERFTVTTANRATSVGPERLFKITAMCSGSCVSGDDVSIYIAKNGTVDHESEVVSNTNLSGRFEGLSSQLLKELDINDYIEIWTTNNTNLNSVTVDNMSVAIEPIN